MRKDLSNDPFEQRRIGLEEAFFKERDQHLIARMRAELEAQLRATGDLPSGVQLGLSPTVSHLKGLGELWIESMVKGSPPLRVPLFMMPARERSAWSMTGEFEESCP